MTVPASAPTFLGRELEQSVLTEAVRQAAEGHGGMVALAGEPGIGKSRLALATAERATELGLTVTWGYCNEHSGAPPFWPWVQAMGDLIGGAGVDAARGWISQANRRVLQLLPALGNPGDGPDAQQTDPAQAEFELLDSTAQLILNASRHKPLCIILEDLHWADNSTLKLLRHLGSDLSRNNILVVGTYRDVEVSRTHPLADTLSELQRYTGFNRVPVRPLDDKTATSLLSEVAGGEQPESTANAVLERADGNPLFILEMARELAHRDYRVDDIRIPEGIRDAIGQRLNRLSSSCTDLLCLAALAGREFSFELMRLVMPDFEPARILDNLEEAVGLSIIEELSGRHGNYRFSHALVQQTLISELSLTQQVRYHAQIAEAMELMLGTAADANASRLALHFRRAETILGPEKALYYSMLAGEQALARSSMTDARTHFSAALEVHGGQKQDQDLAEILYGRGRSSTVGNDTTYQDGWHDMAKSFDIFISLGQAQKAIEIAKYPFYIGIVSNVPDVTSRALELVEQGSIDHGWVLARHGIAVADLGDFKEAAGSLDAAIEIAIKHGDERLHCRALAHLAQTLARNDEPEASIEVGARCKALARKIHDPLSELKLIWCVGQSAITVGDLPLAKSICTDGQKLVDRTPNALGLIVVIKGQWLIARAEAKSVLEPVQRDLSFDEKAMMEAPRPRAVEFMADLDTGTLPGDPDLFDVYESLLSDQFADDFEWFALPGAASFAGHRGSFGEREKNFLTLAVQVLERARKTARPTAENSFHFLSYDAQFATALGQKERAKDLYSRLALLAGRVSPFDGVDVNRSLGRLAALDVDDQLAVDHFEKARNECRDRGYTLELGWSCHDFATASLRMSEGDIGAVRSALQEGIEIAERCGLEHLRESMQHIADENPRLQGQAAFPGGLTGREVEVIRLIAAGRTNRQIAEELVIVETTAAKHVANIMSKIDAVNRTEAATFAIRNGLN